MNLYNILDISSSANQKEIENKIICAEISEIIAKEILVSARAILLDDRKKFIYDTKILKIAPNRAQQENLTLAINNNKNSSFLQKYQYIITRIFS